MSRRDKKPFRETADLDQFSQIPCVTLQEQQPKNISSKTLPIGKSISQDPQSYEYLQYIRQKTKQELSYEMKILAIKTIVFGLMAGIFILILFYDKLFFSYHYYMKSSQYSNGSFGLDFKRIAPQNIPNTNLPDENDFGIKGVKGNHVWDPQKYINKPDHHISSDIKKDKYDLEGFIVEQLMLKNFQFKYNMDEFQFAVHLLQVTHNINFKGQINLQKAKYQKTDSDLKQKRRRIQKILQVQKERYEQKYQISKYIQNQLPFCVVVPSYNNFESRLYLRNLDSIFMQQYQNYHVVYIDDASPDKTGLAVTKYVQENQIPKDKIKIIINGKNVFALENLFTGITQHCKSEEIVMLLDGDDAFLGRQVMALFNAVYQKNRAAVVYSRYFVVSNNDRGGIGGSSREIPHELLEKDKFRAARGFFTSHLLTFYADLFWKIKPADLKYDNKTFFKFAYDVALITPIIEMVGTRIKFIEETTYEYRFDTGINDPGWGQIEVDQIVYERPTYKMLTEFPFIEQFYNKIEKSEGVSKS